MARQTVLDVFGRIYPNATPEMIDYKFRLAQVRCGYHYPSIWYHLLAAKKNTLIAKGSYRRCIVTIILYRWLVSFPV